MRFFTATLIATLFSAVFAAPTEAPNASCETLNYKFGNVRGKSAQYWESCQAENVPGACNNSYINSLRLEAEDLQKQLKAAGCTDGSVGQ